MHGEERSSNEPETFDDRVKRGQFSSIPIKRESTIKNNRDMQAVKLFRVQYPRQSTGISVQRQKGQPYLEFRFTTTISVIQVSNQNGERTP